MEINEQQIASGQAIVESWAHVGMGGPIKDRGRIEYLVRQVYASLGLMTPPIIWAKDPADAVCTIPDRNWTSSSLTPLDSMYTVHWPGGEDNIDNFYTHFANVMPRTWWDAPSQVIQTRLRARVQKQVREHKKIDDDAIEEMIARGSASMRICPDGGLKEKLSDDMMDNIQEAIGNEYGRLTHTTHGWNAVTFSPTDIPELREAWTKMVHEMMPHIIPLIKRQMGVSMQQSSTMWNITQLGNRVVLADLLTNGFGLPLKNPDSKVTLDLLVQLYKEAWFVMLGKDVVAIVDRPTAKFDDDGRLHCEDGPAVVWGDFEVYYIHGVHVQQNLVKHRANITVERISKQPNTELRRMMIDLYGRERYITDSNMEEIHRDDWGVLYLSRQKSVNTWTQDEDFLYVKVTNHTPEPDGEYREFVLRVHPMCRPMLANGRMGNVQERTALNAVASTFGMTGEEYKAALLVQT